MGVCGDSEEANTKTTEIITQSVTKKVEDDAPSSADSQGLLA